MEMLRQENRFLREWIGELEADQAERSGWVVRLVGWARD